jgi:crotonobetainyl-CoA:carnitine CoA-transferase CaiB-like acyl-CoA transferase
MKYNRMADVLADPHLADVGFFEERESPDIGKYRSMKHPVHYAGTPVSNYAHPPMLDADGDEIKAALGMQLPLPEGRIT